MKTRKASVKVDSEALHYAAANGQTEQVEDLLHKGANERTNVGGWRRLYRHRSIVT